MKDFIGLVPGIIILVAVILLDIYIFQLIKSGFQNPNTRRIATIGFWSLAVLFYISFIALFFTEYHAWPGQIRKLVFGFIISWMAAKFIMLPFLLIEDITRFGRWIISLFYSGSGKTLTGHHITRSQFIGKSALLIGGATFGAFIWGVIRTAYNYKVRKIDLKINNLSDDLRGLRIVHISDMHLGSFANTNPAKKFVQIINELEVDLVFFTGDLVNDLSSEAEPFIDVLSKIKAKYGVYSCLGNHDYGNYTNWKSKEAKQKNNDRIRSIHGDFGWNLLRNENSVLTFGKSRLAIIGVENWGHSDHFPKLGDIDKAVLGTEEANVKLLLSHDPSHWDYIISKERNDIDCTFSGHTHGFQFGVEIPALKIKWSPSQYAYKQWAGLYQKDKQQLYVNRGIGFIGYPGRVGIPPEITVFTLSEN